MGGWGRGAGGGLNLVLTSSPTHCVTLAKPSPTSTSVSPRVERGYGKILINPHSQPHEGGVLYSISQKGKQAWRGQLDHSYPARKGARQGLNFGVCVLMG